MPKIDHDSKQKILAAAEKVFHRHGFKGTRTTLIAAEAGISRTMLHYYFSTKEELFQEVVGATFGTVVSHLTRLMGKHEDLQKVIEILIEVLSDVLEEKPDLPSFLVNILNESPEVLLFLPGGAEDNLPAILDNLLKEAQKNGQADPALTGEDVILNIYAICALPYLAAPYIAAKEKRDETAMKTFLRERRAKNLAFILKGIRP